MSKFNHRETMPRYRVIAVVIAVLAITIVMKAAYIMSAQRSYWEKVSARQVHDSVEVKPVRGNIFADEGELLASSLPEYRMYIDFYAMKETKADTLWDEKEDSICRGLNYIFPTMSKEDFRKHLREGREKVCKKKDGTTFVGSRHWPIWKRRVSYSTLSEVQKLPLFRLGKRKSGFHYEEFNARRKPYGSLASRTIGDLFGEKDSARFGFELYYDSVLRGQNGYVNRRKVLNEYISIMLQEPVDGADIITTLDVNIQDLAERSLIDELREIDAELGVAIVMEVQTGDIKALVNMSRITDGNGNVCHDKYGNVVYRETKNNAVADLVEPGSVFKTASILVALDDGKIDTTAAYNVDTGGGVYPMYGREMRDHNWRRGGYGVLTVPQILHFSSNIGVSRLIDRYYKDDPQKFVDGIHRLGLGIDYDLPFPGAAKHARVLGPEDRKKIRGGYWSHTTLPWMSIGYETQVPPIFTVSFYNAIANNGRLMQPRFVKKVVKDGETIAEYPPVCLRERIHKNDAALKKIQAILEGVVSRGLGSKAGSKLFKVAGKTGTAQVAGPGGYKSGAMRYWISFCGYFPYDNPKYTCIVCIKKTGVASGGTMCGKVFHEISEGIMAKYMKTDAVGAHDSTSIVIPDVKSGNLLAADYVLSHLGIKTNGGWDGSYAHGNPIWGHARKDGHQVTFSRGGELSKTHVPDVMGMGARDAVFLLESRGMKVTLYGRGHVTRQSVAPNTKIRKGMSISLDLS